MVPINFSKMIIEWTGTSAAVDANQFAKFFPLRGFFSQLQLMTREGVHLVNITNFNDFNLLSCNPTVSQECLENRQTCVPTITEALAKKKGRIEPIIAADSSAAPANDSFRHMSITTTVLSDTEPSPSTAITPKGIFPGTVMSAIAGGNEPIHMFQVRLGDIAPSLLSYNKVLMFPKDLILQVTFAPTENYYALFDAAATVVNTTVNGGESASITYTDMVLKMVHDTSDLARAAWMSRLQSGSTFKACIPYPVVFKVDIGALTSGSSVIRLSNADGRTCVRIQSAVRLQIERGCAGFNFVNGDLADSLRNVETYQTSLDTMPLQSKILDCDNADDWLLNGHWFKGSCMQGYDRYQSMCPLHIDQFGGNGASLVQSKVTDFYWSGIPLRQKTLLYTRTEYSKLAQAQDCILIAINQRQLEINKNFIAMQ
jgi:hypothetical protein